MEYDSDYILITEDDMLPAKHALDKAYTFMEEHFKKQSLGFVVLFTAANIYHMDYKGKALETDKNIAQLAGGCSFMYRSEDVPGLIEYLKKDPFKDPVDYAVIQYFY